MVEEFTCRGEEKSRLSVMGVSGVHDDVIVGSSLYNSFKPKR